jgi:osmotically-inducible protein OsmY
MLRSSSFSALFAAAAAAPFFAAFAAQAQELNDTDITVAVERQFLADAAVPFNVIDVDTVHGIVTLSGRVDNLGAKMQAERLAEAIKGVRSVIDEITVVPSNLAADDIRRKVVAALLSDPATGGDELAVTVADDGTVTLNGAVQSWAEHELAARVAAGVRGVTGIDNSIDVDFDAERADSAMEADIKERLRWDALVDDALIDVAVADSRAILSGTVGSAAERRRAESDAWVTGIRAVDAKNLDVERWARDPDLRTSKYVRKSDDDIRLAVETALSYDPRVASFDVHVDVTQGRVRLHGIVDNLKAKQAALRTAQNTVGVVDVSNYLRVRPSDGYSDATIDRSVRDALMRDALVDGGDIVVDVDGGVVKLYGAVDTVIEKGEAEELASRIAGVTDIENYLTVRNLDPTVAVPGGRGWYPYGYDYLRADPFGRDIDIAANIAEEMFWSPYVDSHDVKVTVDDGVATLKGTVESRSERQAAVASAYDGGARRVRDEIEIAPTAKG